MQIFLKSHLGAFLPSTNVCAVCPRVQPSEKQPILRAPGPPDRPGCGPSGVDGQQASCLGILKCPVRARETLGALCTRAPRSSTSQPNEQRKGWFS